MSDLFFFLIYFYFINFKYIHYDKINKFFYFAAAAARPGAAPAPGFA